MEVGDIVKHQAKKQALQRQRDHLIKNEIKKRQKEKVNLDQSAVKKGFIQKHKYIEKKKFDTMVEKARKIPVQVQQNANPNTYLSRNTNFMKILTRTQQKVQLDFAAMQDALMAVNAYGISKKQMTINFTLHFQHTVQCEPKPSLISLPYPQACQTTCIVMPTLKEKEGQYPFQGIKNMNLTVLSSSEFIQKYRKDQIFVSRLQQQQIKCLVKFQLFKNSKFYQSLLKKGVPIFPIDGKKVPYSLQAQISSYPEYLASLTKDYFAVIKAGQEQIFRLKVGKVEELVPNSGVIIHELTARLIERDKTKNNRLLKVTAKTATSINFDVYTAQ